MSSAWAIERLDAALVRIWRYRWLSITVAWLVCCLGWLLIAAWPTRYQASAVVFADVAGMRPVASLRDRLVGDQPITQLRNSLVDEAILAEIGRRLGGLPDAPAAVAAQLSVRAATPPIFVVAYDDERPEVATRVLDALLASYVDQHFKLSFDTAALDQQIKGEQQALSGASTRLDQFKQANAANLAGAADLLKNVQAARVELADLRGDLQTALGDQQTLQEQLAKTPVSILPAAAAAQQAPPAPDLSAELAALQKRLGELQVRYADSHPYVVDVQSQIAQLSETVAAAPKPAPVVAQPNPDYAKNQEQLVRQAALIGTLRQRISDQEKRLGELEAAQKTVPQVESRLAELTKDQAGHQASLEQLRQQREQQIERQQAELSQTPFRVIDPASQPVQPTGPSRLLLLAIVLLLGGLIGSAAALLQSRLRGVFETARELRRRLNVAVAGSLSDITPLAERRHRRLAHVGFGLACLGLLGLCSSLMVAQWRDLLLPLGDVLRNRLVG